MKVYIVSLISKFPLGQNCTLVVMNGDLSKGGLIFIIIRSQHAVIKGMHHRRKSIAQRCWMFKSLGYFQYRHLKGGPRNCCSMQRKAMTCEVRSSFRSKTYGCFPSLLWNLAIARDWVVLVIYPYLACDFRCCAQLCHCSHFRDIVSAIETLVGSTCKNCR